MDGNPWTDRVVGLTLRGMKNALRLVAALVLVAILGCGSSGLGLQNRVEVRCVGAGVGYQCSIEHTTGPDPVRACWRIDVVCVNGARTSGSACGEVQRDATSTVLVPLSDFPGAEACDLASGVTVAVESVTPL